MMVICHHCGGEVPAHGHGDTCPVCGCYNVATPAQITEPPTVYKVTKKGRLVLGTTNRAQAEESRLRVHGKLKAYRLTETGDLKRVRV